MTRIAIVASPGTYLASLGAMIDAHSRLGEAFAANPALGDYAEMQTRLVVATPAGGPLSLAGGRTFGTDAPLSSLAGERAIYLPAFQIPDPDRLGARIDAAAPLHHWLRERYEAGAWIGACGSSVCHLAAAGLLDGKPAAIHPRLATGFRSLFPAVELDRSSWVVETGRIMTCGPDGADAQLVLRLLGAVFGEGVARGLLLREAVPTDVADPILEAAKLWIQERFARSLRFGDLAVLLGVSQQTILRRFRAAGEISARAYLQKVRVETAAVMLAETSRPVSEVAQLVGFKDVGSFRSAFVRHLSIPPSGYRRREAQKNL